MSTRNIIIIGVVLVVLMLVVIYIKSISGKPYEGRVDPGSVDEDFEDLSSEGDTTTPTSKPYTTKQLQVAAVASKILKGSTNADTLLDNLSKSSEKVFKGVVNAYNDKYKTLRFSFGIPYYSNMYQDIDKKSQKSYAKGQSVMLRMTKLGLE